MTPNYPSPCLLQGGERTHSFTCWDLCLFMFVRWISVMCVCVCIGSFSLVCFVLSGLCVLDSLPLSQFTPPESDVSTWLRGSRFTESHSCRHHLQPLPLHVSESLLHTPSWFSAMSLSMMCKTNPKQAIQRERNNWAESKHRTYTDYNHSPHNQNKQISP